MTRVRRYGADDARPVVVIGAGIAGLQTALALRRLDPHRIVVLVSKTTLTESNTLYAQGGIAAVIPGPGSSTAEATTTGIQGDSVDVHIADTLAAGAGLADRDAVAVLCQGARQGIDALMAAGVVFDTTPDDPGSLARGREAAHSAPRILHLGGDATGAGLVNTLIRAVRADPGIRTLEHGLVTRILLDNGATGRGRAMGIEMLVGTRRSHREHLLATAVVLATGGAGQLFEHTTNPAIATGDGVALGWRAGAAVTDLEFFQFHPTSLHVPGNPLISEAVRGEGAYLHDSDGHRFMPDYHPDGDLAPRDVVSRSIAQHLAQLPSRHSGRSTGATGRQDRRVYLDATALGHDFLARRFPTLTRLTARHGSDWSTTVVPVVPAAHYWMGGVRTDLYGRTSVPGLFAVGEAARTGVHGANRLASNSLLEAVVFGTRCAAAIISGEDETPRFDVEHLDPETDDTDDTGMQPFTRRDLQNLMSDHAGVLRTGEGLKLAGKHLASYHPGADPELANLLLCAKLLVRAAADRHSSCGAHYRLDQRGTSPNSPSPSRSYAQTTTEGPS